jgi:transcriptional regulator GlxA family with amidase domain
VPTTKRAAQTARRPVDALIVAVPETAGSALYGMVDVLLAAGNLWQTLVRAEALPTPFRVRIVSTMARSFECGNRIPVVPDVTIDDETTPDIVIVPELWIGPDEVLDGRFPALVEWLRHQHRRGATLYSACSGALLLAETGLLDGCEATSHWGYQDMFRKRYPRVRFRPEPNLAFADARGRIVTAGGTTSWHDLAVHIIARHCSPGEALRIAKVYLLKWHGEGQLPYKALVRNDPHSDAVVHACESWLGKHFRERRVLEQVTARSRVPERTLKRRFKQATGKTLIAYLQDVRIEEAKRLLEADGSSVDEISSAVGYEDPSFFRRLFRRCTGLAPNQYRRLFAPVLDAKRDVRPRVLARVRT